jgi:hypothetical protein
LICLKCWRNLVLSANQENKKKTTFVKKELTRGRLPSGSSRKMNWLLTSRTFPSINRASPKRSQVILEKQVGQRSPALLILAMTAMIRSEGSRRI